jgi:endoribonuclease Dicer
MRAQTRGRESHFIHFVEKGNEQDRRIIYSQIWANTPVVNEWKESILSGPKSLMPPRNLKETVDPYRSEDEEENEDVPFISDPTTSGRIYLQDAVTAIHRFIACFRGPEDDTSREPLYTFDHTKSPDIPKEITCTVFLPQACPVPAITGPPHATISEARRAASFQACQELFNRGLLDYRFFPRHSIDTSSVEVEADTGKPKSRAVQPLPSQSVDFETKPSGNKLYLRKQPDFWVNILAAPHQTLYPTIVIPRYPTDLVSSHAAVLIVTWKPLPPIDEFDLYFFGHLGSVRLLPAVPFSADEGRVNDLYTYTLMLYRTMAYKPLMCSLEDMPYFLCPLESSWVSACQGKTTLDRPDVVDHIPWESVSIGGKTWKVPFRSNSAETLAEDLENAVVREYDSEYSKPYAFLQVRPDLTPLSQPSENHVVGFFLSFFI